MKMRMRAAALIATFAAISPALSAQWPPYPTANAPRTAGGQVNLSRTTACFLAPLGPGGAIGAWTAVTSLPEPIAGAGAVSYGGYVYLVGGSTDGSGNAADVVDTIWSAPVP